MQNVRVFNNHGRVWLGRQCTFGVKIARVNAWWRHQMETFSALLAICAGNSPVPVNSSYKGQWRGALMFSLICIWIKVWVNNSEAGDLRCHRGHYDVNVMVYGFSVIKILRRVQMYVDIVGFTSNCQILPFPWWNTSLATTNPRPCSHYLISRWRHNFAYHGKIIHCSWDRTISTLLGLCFCLFCFLYILFSDLWIVK